MVPGDGDFQRWEGMPFMPGFGPTPNLRENLEFWEQYSIALFWGFGATTSLGSILVPTNGLESVHCVIITFFGTFIFAFIVGEVCRVVQGPHTHPD